MIIQLREKETAFATNKSPNRKEGDLITAHPILIKEFIEKGLAVKEKPKAKAKEEKQ